MTMHISEIGVRLAVAGSEPGAGPTAPPAPPAGGGVALSPAQEEAIVSRCVERVIANLKAAEAR